MGLSVPRSLLSVLIVAYHFPPIGGGGVQRAAKFARYLPEFGVRPIVLTGSGVHADRWTPDDPTMLGEVADLDVVRAGAEPRPTSSGWRWRLERTLGLDSAFSRWWIDSIVRDGQPAGRDVDVILAELVRYEAAFGAERLARSLGIPWVADLQDPWALDEMWLYPSAYHRLKDRGRMRRTLRTAAAVVMNSPEAAARLIAAFPEFSDRLVVSITNGFDAEDFRQPVRPRDDGVFRIVHSGYMHTDQGLRQRRIGGVRRLLGGMPVPGIDFLTRSHVFLMQAVDAAMREDPTLNDLIEVHLVGQLTQADRDAAAPYPFVRLLGYKSHAESVAIVRGADLLFLPMHDLPAETRAGLVPGKAYEYMGSGRPILAAIPDGDAREYLGAVGTATICRPAAVDCMTAAIRKYVGAWREGTPSAEADPTVLASFERRQLTGELARVLLDVGAGPGAAAG